MATCSIGVRPASASMETWRGKAQPVKAREGFRVSLAGDGLLYRKMLLFGCGEGDLLADTVPRASVVVGGKLAASGSEASMACLAAAHTERGRRVTPPYRRDL